jgi:hypothetical protein
VYQGACLGGNELELVAFSIQDRPAHQANLLGMTRIPANA